MITRWIVGNKLAAGSLALSAVLGGLAGVFWLGWQSEEVRADREALRASQEASRASGWETSFRGLQGAVREQQEAVRRVVEAAAEASGRAQLAMREAAKRSAVLTVRADAVRAEAKPVGADLCERARDAFARELREERPDGP